jgi:hypothetical protein
MPESSPAFRLFGDTYLYDWMSIGDHDERALVVDNHLKFAAARLPRMFEQGEASPYDRTPNGMSLLHVSVPIVACPMIGVQDAPQM